MLFLSLSNPRLLSPQEGILGIAACANLQYLLDPLALLPVVGVSSLRGCRCTVTLGSAPVESQTCHESCVPGRAQWWAREFSDAHTPEILTIQALKGEWHCLVFVLTAGSGIFMLPNFLIIFINFSSFQ